MKYVIGFIHRLVYASLTAIVIWILYVFPFEDRARRLRFGVVKVLDLPLAIVSQHLPLNLRGIDVFSDYPFAHNMRPDEMLLLHLRVAVPVYLLLFYIPTVIIWLNRKLQNDRKTDLPGSDIVREN